MSLTCVSFVTSTFFGYIILFLIVDLVLARQSAPMMTDRCVAYVPISGLTWRLYNIENGNNNNNNVHLGEDEDKEEEGGETVPNQDD